jgi:hypothetical protein
MEIKTTARLLIAFSLLTTSTLVAESSSKGTDMWTRVFDQWGLFTPHENYCDTTEEFFSVSGTSSRGFCMEKNERSAETWEDARDACAADRKRLPEPGEWKFACRTGSSLTNMSNNWEWASNFAIDAITPTGAGGASASIAGAGGCSYGSVDWINRNDGTVASNAFRCVR